MAPVLVAARDTRRLVVLVLAEANKRQAAVALVPAVARDSQELAVLVLVEATGCPGALGPVLVAARRQEPAALVLAAAKEQSRPAECTSDIRYTTAELPLRTSDRSR